MKKTLELGSFSTTIGHKTQIEYLKSNISTDDLAHAYLFVGEEHIGKKLVAKEFIKSVLCSESKNFCGTCKNCQSVDRGVHPDVVQIENDGAIKIEQVRRIISNIGLKPFSSKVKVALIDNADDLTQESSNALLKTLEEPPGHALIILIAKNKNSLLPTIVSRTRVIKFFRTSDEVIKEIAKIENVSGTDSSLVKDISMGRPGILKELVEERESLGEIREKAEGLVNLVEGNSKFEKLEYSASLAASYSKDTESALVTLRVWLVELRGLLYKAFAEGDAVLFKDLPKEKISKKGLIYVIKYLNWVLNTLSNPRSGFNVKLLMDLAVLNLGKIKNGK